MNPNGLVVALNKTQRLKTLQKREHTKQSVCIFNSARYVKKGSEAGEIEEHVCEPCQSYAQSLFVKAGPAQTSRRGAKNRLRLMLSKVFVCARHNMWGNMLRELQDFENLLDELEEQIFKYSKNDAAVYTYKIKVLCDNMNKPNTQEIQKSFLMKEVSIEFLATSPEEVFVEAERSEEVMAENQVLYELMNKR